MKLYRIRALLKRHVYLFPRSFDRMTDAFFWPIMELLLWGLTIEWVAGGKPSQHEYVVAMFTSLVLWRIVWQSNYEVGVNFLEECWNRNLTNILSSPLTKLEWLTANLSIGIIKGVVVVIVMWQAARISAGIDIFALGKMWWPAVVCLTLNGWSIGFLAATIVLYFGLRAQAVTWTLCYLFTPVSAAYFPVDVLPAWLRAFSEALPMTKTFEMVRKMIFTGEFDVRLCETAAYLSILYFVLCLGLFNYAFEKTRERGFDHLE